MLNPKTNRMIKKDSKIGRKLIKEQQTTKLNLSELLSDLTKSDGDKKSFLVDGTQNNLRRNDKKSFQVMIQVIT